MLDSILINFLTKKTDNPNFKGVKLLKLGKSEIEYIEIIHNPQTSKEERINKVYKLNDDDKFILNLEIAQLLN